MPNIKSAKKRVLTTADRSETNRAAKSALKTAIKKFEVAAAVEDNREAAQTAYATAVKTIDQAVKKGILHKNTAARKKSNITLKMNKIA
ncbi:MAG: 30S ribosomal protein S20 [Oscillospiraceae bacterium]|nr:30S ribosomal protein S20 [Oscillospiraceae bacterium]